MDDVRLPRLLQKALDSTGNSLKEVCRLHPISLSVELNLYPLSRATMVLAESDPAVQIHDFVELFSQNGSLGVFRVVSVSTTYKKQRQLQLNHALDLFSDALLPGETAITGTVQNALAQIVAGQTANLNGTPYWRLGTCEDTSQYAIDVKYTNAMQCITDLAKNEEDYYFTFDFSRFPWRLNFVARNEDVLTEFRLPRNMESCQVNLDDSDLCTKLYLSVDTTTTSQDGDTTTTTHEIHNDTAAQSTWGIVAKTAGIKAEAVPDKAAWVQQYFKQHAQPTVQISITGAELNKYTGEPLDEMHMGRICRVALPDYDAVFNERIVSLSYPDILRNPMRVTVSLANKKQTAEGAFSGLSSRTASTAAAAKENEKSIQNNNTQTQYKWRVTDEHVTDQGNILHAAGLEIDAHGVWLYASEDGPNYALGASFKVQSDSITAEVDRATKAEGTMSSRITQTADAITAEVSRATAEEGTLSSRITQTADQIALKVSKGDVSTQLAVECGNVTISGGNLVVDGYVEAEQIMATGSASAAYIKASNLLLTSGNININSVSYSPHTISMGSGASIRAVKALAEKDYDFSHYHAITATESDGKIVLTLGAVQSSEGTANFKIADTKAYKDGVSAVTLKNLSPSAGTYYPDYGVYTNVTVNLTNGKSASQYTYVPVTIPQGKTVTAYYPSSFEVTNVVKTSRGYTVYADIKVKVEYSDGTSDTSGAYSRSASYYD